MKDKINSYAKSGQVVRRPYFWNPDREYETTYEVDLKELAKKYKKKLKI